MKTQPRLSIIKKFTHGMALALAIPAFFVAVPARATVNIPALTWTQRSDWLNVKSAPFNAVGDGVADDTAAIQAALTLAGTCNAQGQAVGTKRTVYLPSGTYKISRTLNWKGTNTPWTDGGSGLQLIGCGRNTTIVWSGSSGAAMFATNSATCTNYIGITWNGNNLAGAGYRHDATVHLEDPVRHENEAFYNFTVNGTYLSGTTCPPCGIMNGSSASTVFSADVLVWNCLFNNCTNGLIIGYQVANDYQWCIEGCEFENCGTGVRCNDGMSVIFDCHFQGSTVTDIYTTPSLAQSVRSCTSQGSKAFFSVAQSAGYGIQKVQDCRIEGWTSTISAIELDGCGPTLISDCVFTNPPNTASPIRLNNNMYGWAKLLISNNYCPPTCTALVAPGSYSTIGSVPPGSQCGPTAALSSGSTIFLQTSWPADSANILDVTGTAYNADKTGVTDATTAIQNAINAAKAANNGSIVYLPVGTYKVTSTLALSGSNYAFQGAGLCSNLKWSGTNGGIVISVTSPYSLAIEQLNIACDPSVTAIKQTATTGGDMIYDGIQNTLFGDYSSNYNGLGIQLVGLPAGSRVLVGHILSPLTANDCGPAEIFGQYVENGMLSAKGATKAKTGFVGFSNLMTGIHVDDNQDLAVGHFYQEQGTSTPVQIDRGAASGSGRVSIQGVKINVTSGTTTSLQINNYQGRVLFGPTYFANNASTIITQTGSNALDLILPGDMFLGTAPTITTSTSCNLTLFQDIYGSTFPADTIAPGGMASMAAGFDHLRQLFAEDLKLLHGIQNTVANSFFETDPVNSFPLTVMGTAPASWSVSGGTSVGLGVRSVSVVSPGSPFSSGTAQSASFVDTTGTNIGSRLAFNQSTAAIAASVPAVFSFDVRLNPMTGNNDDVWVRVFCGSATAHSIHLTGNSTSGAYGPATLSLNTWYRIRAVIQAPSLGAQNITLYVTPWTVSGPGITSTYTVAGSLTGPSTTGFTSVQWNAVGAGENANINFDNITLVTGDPLLQ